MLKIYNENEVSNAVQIPIKELFSEGKEYYTNIKNLWWWWNTIYIRGNPR